MAKRFSGDSIMVKKDKTGNEFKIIIRKCAYCGKTGKHKIFKDKTFRHINCKFKSPI